MNRQEEKDTIYPRLHKNDVTLQPFQTITKTLVKMIDLHTFLAVAGRKMPRMDRKLYLAVSLLILGVLYLRMEGLAPNFTILDDLQRIQLYVNETVSAEEALKQLKASRGLNQTFAVDELRLLLLSTTIEPIANVDTLQKKTLLTVNMFSNPGYVRDGFRARKRLFFPYQSDHSVLAVIPMRHFSDVIAVYTKLTLPKTLDQVYTKLIEETDGVKYGPLLRWIQDGTEVFFQGIIATPPSWYYSQKKTPHIKCHHKGWGLRYAMYSGAVFSYHILKLPILYKYEYMLKLDVDIHFHHKMPDLGRFFRRKGQRCLVAHSAMQTSDDCEKEVPLALQLFAKQHPQHGQPKSFGHPWCNHRGHILKKFYGNFVVYSTERLLLHPTVQAMSSFFYHNFSQGFFQYRWGDQAPPIAFLCMLYEIENITNDYRICDISYLRDRDFFRHD